jgi:hypothetical protein
VEWHLLVFQMLLYTLKLTPSVMSGATFRGVGKGVGVPVHTQATCSRHQN